MHSACALIARGVDAEGRVVTGVVQDASGRGDLPVTVRELDGFTGDLTCGATCTDRIVRLERLLAPVDPPDVYCVGLNYADHASEANFSPPKFPVHFLKATSSVSHHCAPIVIPKCASAKPEVDFEAELALVVGRPCRDADPEAAASFLAGYTAANDVSARRWQGKKGGGQWSRSKSFDSFCPLGPFLVFSGGVDPATGVLVHRAGAIDYGALPVRSDVNGRAMQDSSTANMVFSAARLLAFLSQDTTLRPGTVVLTGTPSVRARDGEGGEGVSLAPCREWGSRATRPSTWLPGMRCVSRWGSYRRS